MAARPVISDGMAAGRAGKYNPDYVRKECAMSKEAARMIAALVKSAANEDFAGSLAKLETLRQNAGLRHQVLREGAGAGGARGGGMVGGGAGAGGGLLAAIKGLAGSRMGGRGKIGLGAISTLMGGLGGGMAGSSIGRTQGLATVPDLPHEMNSPVSLTSAPAVSQFLSKNAMHSLGVAAMDKGLADRLEKSAGPMDMLAKGVGGLMGGGKRLLSTTVGRPMTSRMPGAGAFGPRQFSPGRTAGLMGAGAGGVVGGHMYENAQDQTGVGLNPMTWGRGSIGRSMGMSGGPSPEDIFKRHQAGYDEARHGIQSEMDGAVNDPEKFKQLNERFQQGDFKADTGWNPMNWSMGGLNPFGKQTGVGHQGHMLEQQKALQGQYNTEAGKSGPQAGDQDMQKYLEERMQSPDLLPAQHQAMQKQLDAMKSRMSQAPGTPNDAASAIKHRMESSGMRFNPLRPQGGGQQGPKPSGGWNLGGRPRMPGYMTGAAMMPGDFRPYQQPWDYVQNSNSSPFMQNG